VSGNGTWEGRYGGGRKMRRGTCGKQERRKRRKRRSGGWMGKKRIGKGGGTERRTDGKGQWSGCGQGMEGRGAAMIPLNLKEKTALPIHVELPILQDLVAICHVYFVYFLSPAAVSSNTYVHEPEFE
jgi:hypothetical protein